jgi:hypothetical protein
MFILSLAIADLTVGLIVMPISSVYVLLGDWILGLLVCQLWLVIDYTASTASIFNLLILSLDRYWSIRSPLKYLCKRTKKRALGMIGIVWLISVLWAIPIIGMHIKNQINYQLLQYYIEYYLTTMFWRSIFQNFFFQTVID